jgi:hypothetical protein
LAPKIESKTWIAGTSPVMTPNVHQPGEKALIAEPAAMNAGM